jgi:hypothetical protein
VTAREYLNKLHQYFHEHYEDGVDPGLVIREKEDCLVLLVKVSSPHAFLNWWGMVYVPLDSWIHEYNADSAVTSDGVVAFTARKASGKK